ncbi:dynein heavy chain, partial [Kipferlia bialata]|eukprot:g10903.t1
MNMSKLVDEDAPLFISLTEDLFPGLRVPKTHHDELESSIRAVIDEDPSLIHHDPWVLSLIQLYETSLVRHGIMVLGPAQVGKTQCISGLAKSLTRNGQKHSIWRMNPKAITAPQMFGKLDAQTGDWTDGIFSTLWRRAAKREGEYIWIVLDGPVDSLWIENLNTVLDDNKTLTLANSDRIPMSNTLKLIFEVTTLENASPATVSRAGMIYMSAMNLGWEPVYNGWAATRPANQTASLSALFSEHIQELLTFVETQLHAVMYIPQIGVIRSMLDILVSLLPEDTVGSKKGAVEFSPAHIGRLFVYALVWSLGGTLDLLERTTFTKEIIKRGLDCPTLTGEQTLYDYFVDES